MMIGKFRFVVNRWLADRLQDRSTFWNQVWPRAFIVERGCNIMGGSGCCWNVLMVRSVAWVGVALIYRYM